MRTCYLKWEKYVVSYILITLASSTPEVKPHGWRKALYQKRIKTILVLNNSF